MVFIVFHKFPILGKIFILFFFRHCLRIVRDIEELRVETAIKIGYREYKPVHSCESNHFHTVCEPNVCKFGKGSQTVHKQLADHHEPKFVNLLCKHKGMFMGRTAV